MPLRAYLESHRVGDMTRSPDDVYPGFDRAVLATGKLMNDPGPDLPYEIWNIQPATEPLLGDAQKYYGNEYFHVLNLAPIDGGYRAYVCDGLYNVFREGDDSYVSVIKPTENNVIQGATDPDRFGVKLWRVELSDQNSGEEHPASVALSQKGPNPAPANDVFGPWRITGASPDALWGSQDAPDSTPGGWGRGELYNELNQQCLDRMPHDASQRHDIYTNQLDTPPSAEPALPGWPSNLLLASRSRLGI
ncbi:hypothetical protein AWC31_25800 [Mycolicibacterium wolinskyi]|uniref:Uncharacterized protein n=2 Tax=Mycobacteriaceae TaxID=1762 RepID=A0A1X2F830_9MYCO|nr:hypothetical protein AWC31_25800 [Mycolicibacterium wolinskyi]